MASNMEIAWTLCFDDFFFGNIFSDIVIQGSSVRKFFFYIL